ncbi:MAG: TRAP transporter substrate-binding protein [Lachnospiraceae bacterium]|nr:TRAP transporter substrate-binding protein [Lachnospiraceae bacterium]
MVTVIATSAVGPLTASAADVTLTMAEVNPADTIVGQMDQAFADKVAELSGGSMQINIMFSGVLGAEEDVLDTMLGGGGTIDISRISAFALTSYGGEKSMLLSLPYTFESREHFWAFATSDLAQEFLLEPVENGTGIRGLFYGEEGFRHFFTVDEVSGIEDLAGMKIRVSNDAIMNGLVEGLGASPTVVSFTELYSALQTGVVDAAEQPIANYQSNAFPEVAPNLILDGHTLGAVQVVMTDDAWNSLTEEQQAIITEAGEYASNYCREISQSAEDEVLAELIEEGVNVVEVDDLTPWQEAVADLVAENIEGQEDLYQQLLDFADAAE